MDNNHKKRKLNTQKDSSDPEMPTKENTRQEKAHRLDTLSSEYTDDVMHALFDNTISEVTLPASASTKWRTLVTRPSPLNNVHKILYCKDISTSVFYENQREELHKKLQSAIESANRDLTNQQVTSCTHYLVYSLGVTAFHWALLIISIESRCKPGEKIQHTSKIELYDPLHKSQDNEKITDSIKTQYRQTCKGENPELSLPSNLSELLTSAFNKHKIDYSEESNFAPRKGDRISVQNRLRIPQLQNNFYHDKDKVNCGPLVMAIFRYYILNINNFSPQMFSMNIPTQFRVTQGKTLGQACRQWDLVTTIRKFNELMPEKITDADVDHLITQCLPRTRRESFKKTMEDKYPTYEQQHGKVDFQMRLNVVINSLWKTNTEQKEILSFVLSHQRIMPHIYAMLNYYDEDYNAIILKILEQKSNKIYQHFLNEKKDFLKALRAFFFNTEQSGHLDPVRRDNASKLINFNAFLNDSGEAIPESIMTLANAAAGLTPPELTAVLANPYFKTSKVSRQYLISFQIGTETFYYIHEHEALIDQLNFLNQINPNSLSKEYRNACFLRYQNLYNDRHEEGFYLFQKSLIEEITNHSQEGVNAEKTEKENTCNSLFGPRPENHYCCSELQTQIKYDLIDTLCVFIQDEIEQESFNKAKKAFDLYAPLIKENTENKIALQAFFYGKKNKPENIVLSNDNITIPPEKKLVKELGIPARLMPEIFDFIKNDFPEYSFIFSKDERAHPHTLNSLTQLLLHKIKNPPGISPLATF